VEVVLADVDGTDEKIDLFLRIGIPFPVVRGWNDGDAIAVLYFG